MAAINPATIMAAVSFAKPIFEIVIKAIKTVEETIKGYKKGPERKEEALKMIEEALGKEGLWKDLPEGKVKEIMAKISDQIETWLPILKAFGMLETKYEVTPEDISQTPPGGAA